MIARVGRRDHGKEPLPTSHWRTYLRHLAKWMLVAIAMLLALTYLMVAYA